jgi:hypothetical protein
MYKGLTHGTNVPIEPLVDRDVEIRSPLQQRWQDQVKVDGGFEEVLLVPGPPQERMQQPNNERGAEIQPPTLTAARLHRTTAQPSSWHKLWVEIFGARPRAGGEHGRPSGHQVLLWFGGEPGLQSCGRPMSPSIVACEACM